MGTRTKGVKSKGSRSKDPVRSRGQLRIGDQWNAITILAFSQSNPLKAIAEFVENSIDAGATRVHIFRGKKGGESYLRIVDNGRGIPKDQAGVPDFKYVATHVCNSIKRKLKAEGAKGIQGEFGIGLLSFWTVGEQLVLRSPDVSGQVHQMTLKKGHSGYEITRSRALLAEPGTELIVQPLLPGLKQLSGERLQWFLSVELRNRLIDRGVSVRIHDLTSRNEYLVEPQRYTGRKLTLPALDVIRAEIFLNSPSLENRVALYRNGTRVLENLSTLTELDSNLWESGYLTGFIDGPQLQLTPGTRLGVIQDDKYELFVFQIRTLEDSLNKEIAQLKEAEEERATKATYVTLHKAFREALEGLPVEEYDWFDLKKSPERRSNFSQGGPTSGFSNALSEGDLGESLETTSPSQLIDESSRSAAPVQPAFFEFPGPLCSIRVAPASSLVPVGKERKFRAVARDRKGTPVTSDLSYRWELLEGAGKIQSEQSQEILFAAPIEPGLSKLRVTVKQEDIECVSEAVVTVTDSLIQSRSDTEGSRRGLPNFTFERSPGESWRSRFEQSRNLIVVNSGHRDFLFAASKSNLKMRYLVRIFSKELVLFNFPGISANELLDRQIEVSLRAEEYLR